MIDWDQIDTVFLDMDGTLLDLHFDNYFWLQHIPQRYAEKHGMPPERAYQKLMKQFKEREGSLSWYCIDYWSETLQLDIPVLKREIQHKIQFRPHVTDFLDLLKTTNKNAVIVTNAHQESIKLKLQFTGLNKWVDRIICSHDLDCPKEHSEFWHKLQRHQSFSRKSTLLIDDSLPVLRAARDYGIQHLLTILQPDSQQPNREINEFLGIDSFADIHPPTMTQDE